MENFESPLSHQELSPFTSLLLSCHYVQRRLNALLNSKRGQPKRAAPILRNVRGTKYEPVFLKEICAPDPQELMHKVLEEFRLRLEEMLHVPKVFQVHQAARFRLIQELGAEVDDSSETVEHGGDTSIFERSLIALTGLTSTTYQRLCTTFLDSRPLVRENFAPVARCSTRHMTRWDLPQVLEIERLSLPDESDEPLRWTLEDYAKAQEGLTNNVYLLDASKSPILGLMATRYEKKVDKATGSGLFINHLLIHPAVQGMGAEEKLLEKAIRRAHGLYSGGSMIARIREDQSSAASLYLQSGFMYDQTIQGHDSPYLDVDALQYVRHLEPEIGYPEDLLGHAS